MRGYERPRPSGLWMALDYHYVPSDPNSTPALGRWNGREFYWNGGLGHAPYSKETLPPIIKEYPQLEGESDNEWADRVEVQFAKDWPLVPMTDAKEARLGSQRAYGWLSPEGDYYPCQYFEHNMIGFRVAKQIYGIVSDWEGLNHIREQGWASLSEGYISLKDDDMVTPAQIQTLIKVVLPAVKDEKAKHKLLETIEDYSNTG